VNGLIDVFAKAGNFNEFVLYIWYNPWVLFCIYNFGLWWISINIVSKEIIIIL